MAKEMLINVSEGEECRIALLENGTLEEFYIERTSATSHVGNIYHGRVVNVEASIQAAFIDFGLGRNGFLHISDLQPSYFGRRGEDVSESVGRKLARRDRPPIQRCLRRGDEITVQIIKEGIGTKGPTLTTYLSIPGRILVMMPGMSKMGVSRKIEDEVERRRLRQILDSLEPPEDCGFIIRTAGVGKSKTEIQRDLAYLARLWQQVTKKLASGGGPMSLYTEGDLVTRTVRDVFTTEIDRIIIDNARVAEQVREFIKLTSPRAKEKVELYQEQLPLFHKYNIEKEIEMMYSRHVPLPSGGSLVIDQTEAVVAIDVNSGKFRDHSDAETTAFKTDMEAADEIPRQLKLRDLGGVIICDFIDLRYERHRRELEHKLHDHFKNDRAKTKVLRMSQFGIIELTRQRMRPSVKRSIYCDCPHCRGSGLVKTPESMSLDVMRKLAIATHDQRVVRVELTVHDDVAHHLGNRKRKQLADLESATGKKIIIKTGRSLGLDEVRFELYDSRDGIVTMPDLLAHTPQSIQEAQLMVKQARFPERRERDGRRGRPERQERRSGGFEEAEDRFGREELDEEIHEGRHAEGEEQEAPADYQEPSEAPEEISEEVTEDVQPAPIADKVQEHHHPAPQQWPQVPQAQPRQQQPSRPQQREQYAQQGEEGWQGRRRRGRRGRGRGRGEQQQAGPMAPPPHREGDEIRHIPSTIWIEMPGEGAAGAGKHPQRNAPAKAQIPARQQPAVPAVPAAPAAAVPARPTAPVSVAPIAEWVDRPVLRKAPPAPTVLPPQPLKLTTAAHANEDDGEDGKGKRRRGGKKPAGRGAAKPSGRRGAGGRSKKGVVEVSDGDVQLGGEVDEPTRRIAPIAEEPKVRIADEPALTRNGDRHLASDEPVDPESVRTVSSRRDLDHVPDEQE